MTEIATSFKQKYAKLRETRRIVGSVATLVYIGVVLWAADAATGMLFALAVAGPILGMVGWQWVSAESEIAGEAIKLAFGALSPNTPPGGPARSEYGAPRSC